MEKKKKTIILSSIILGVLVLTLGIAYAIFTYNAESANQQLILGDIWMSYNETSTNIQLKDAMPQDLLADDFVSRGILNPIMKEQTVEYENELTACVSFVSAWGVNLDEGSTLETYCQGTGTMGGGFTFQNDLNDFYLYGEYSFEYLSSNNIIIQDGENYIVNPIMTNQTVGEINELNRCVSSLINFMYDGELFEGETWESFCKGEGTLQGLTYSEHSDNRSSFYVNTYDILIQLNIVLDKNFLKTIDLPYFEFTINGKNTYTEQDIKYEIVLNNSEYIDEAGIRTERIQDKFLKFSLVEVNDSGAELVFHNRSYETLTNKSVFINTISNTDGTINRTYRLYMWIGDEVVIGGGEATYDYDMATWNKIYASVRVDVKGDFIDKEVTNDYVPATDSASFKRLVNNQFQDTTYVDTDGTVYLSGSNDEVNYNYVWYSGKLWRIIAINSDGTMKMVTDGLITSINWGEKATVSNTDLTSAYSTSYIREWLNQDFLLTLNNYEDIIVKDAGWYSITDSNSIPTKPIGNYTLTDPVGLLNAYEYYMSYKNTSYSMGYLNIGYAWWLITPYNSSYVYYVSHHDGRLVDSSSYMPDKGSGVRPSINLKSTIKLVEGSGTVDNPYKIKGDRKNIEENVTLINTRGSGEYVKLSSEKTAPTFRIVDTELVGESLTTKIVLNDYVRDTNDIDADSNTTEVLSLKFGTTNSWDRVSETDPTYWRGYLNNTWIREIDNTYNAETGISNILEKGTYYLGYHSTGSYKGTVCSTVSSEVSVKKCIENGTTNTSSDDYVGLLRVGEMFASQFGTGSSSSEWMWLITPTGSSSVRFIHSVGRLDYNISSSIEKARPTINLKSTLVIKSGSGTREDPFVVGLPEEYPS